MDRDKTINKAIERFAKDFKRNLKNIGLDVPEINDEIIKTELTEYFNKKTLSEAHSHIYHVVEKYVDGHDSYKDIDWSVERSIVVETEAYKTWHQYEDIEEAWYASYRTNNLDKIWVEANGRAHTEEEAAKIAADKWCELLFNWHFQDNGASNEDHPGGFTACALGTILGNKCRENVTEEMEADAHELFKQYYLKEMHFNRTYDLDDIQWLKDTLPDKTGKFDWKYGFCDLSCDYDPSWALYLILLHAGIPEKSISGLCPWKTRITIRKEDNAVMYGTYQHCEEL